MSVLKHIEELRVAWLRGEKLYGELTHTMERLGLITTYLEMATDDAVSDYYDRMPTEDRRLSKLVYYGLTAVMINLGLIEEELEDKMDNRIFEVMK